jgi:hypothetical protein
MGNGAALGRQCSCPSSTLQSTRDVPKAQEKNARGGGEKRGVGCQLLSGATWPHGCGTAANSVAAPGPFWEDLKCGQKVLSAFAPSITQPGACRRFVAVR